MEHNGIKIVKIEHNFPYLKKYLEDNPITEEGLNKARYNLGYDDGYRECLKNVCKYIKDNSEMFDDSFSDIDDLIELITEAVDED